MITTTRKLLAAISVCLLAAPLALRASDRASHTYLSDLSGGARAAVSTALGRDSADYQVQTTPDGVEAANPVHNLACRFTAKGVEIDHEGSRLQMRVIGYGYGDRLAPAAAVAPTGSLNRVEYQRGALVEWYSNGPGGLEQGFTIARSPRGGTGGVVAIATAVSGTLALQVDPGAASVSLISGHNRVLTYSGLMVYDASGRSLPAWVEARHGRISLKYDDRDARYPVTVDPWVQDAKLTASDGAASDHLGVSVAISGTTVVVGAPGATVGSNAHQGKAYVFVKPSGGWSNMTQAAILEASDGAAGDSLGVSVSVDSDTVVVGADEATVGSATEGGAAYVFVKPSGGWTGTVYQAAKLTTTDESSYYGLGESVSISGGVISAGASGIFEAAFTGRAYVFVEPGGGWADMTQSAKLNHSATVTHDLFGFSISTNGATVVVGARDAEVGSNSLQGAAYVFLEPAGGWTDVSPTAELTASDGAASDLFGSSAAIGGSVVVVGSVDATIGSNAKQGAAYVYEKPTGGWTNMTQTAKLTVSGGAQDDEFGHSVSIAGTGKTIVAGAMQTGSNCSNCGPGAAYVFVSTGTHWSNMNQTTTLTASDGVDDDAFGSSVSYTLDGTTSTIVVGAENATVGSNASQGKAYVFTAQ